MNHALAVQEKSSRSATACNTNTMNDRPITGIGVMIFRENKVLLGKRMGAHGVGEYAFPGGHLEYMESFEECARRETREECGITITKIRFGLLSNVKTYAPKHYVHIGLIADWESGEPKVCEPKKCEGWEWYALDALPSPIFEPALRMIEGYKNAVLYMDT